MRGNVAVSARSRRGCWRSAISVKGGVKCPGTTTTRKQAILTREGVAWEVHHSLPEHPRGVDQ